MQTSQKRPEQKSKPEPPRSAGVLVLPAENSASGDARETLNALRRFHHGVADPGGGLAPPRAEWLPALMHAYRHAESVRTDYPLFLHPIETQDVPICTPLAHLLARTVEAIAPGDDNARILKDNLVRLEGCVRELLGEQRGPVDALTVLQHAGEHIQEELSLAPESRQELHSSLEALFEAIPGGGRLLLHNESAAVRLFLQAARSRFGARRKALRDEVESLCQRLHDLLRIEQTRHVAPDGGEVVAGSIGSGGAAYVNADALAQVMATSASAAKEMDAERRARIENAIAVMQRWLAQDDVLPVVIVHDAYDVAGFGADEAEWRSVRSADVCRTAAAVFDELAASQAALFTAVRVARLELADAYDPARHDRLLNDLQWDAFTREELLAMPKVLALPAATHVAGEGMAELSRLLLSGRPVEVLVSVRPASGSNEDVPLGGYRFELSYLGLSHREALVHQSSSARPEHLVAGFLASMDATDASLHVIASGVGAEGEPPKLGAWLYAGAALEGRAHPFFHYNPEAGATWAKRLNFASNPAPTEDWSTGELVCQTADGAETSLTAAFTFADYALLEPGLAEHFCAIPDDVARDALTPIADYLELPAEAAADALPFVWAADADGRLHRVLVDRPLALATRDRLDYWRTLQELAGVRNEHVREAVQRERERMEAEFAAEREQIEQTHAAALEQARNEAASESMQRLAQALLDTNFAELPVAGASPQVAPAPRPAADEPKAAPAGAEAAPAAGAEEEDDDLVPREPWITTALCTSCNDCVNLNSRMFVYNANKQAVIGDASAGTYEQLVQAAEKCPARCIHPGLPLNADEPGAEGLIERAKPFN